jgi:hypothetical protein
VQNDDEFSDYDGECKNHDACEYLRIVDSKHCVNSDTLLFLHKPGQMVHLGSRLSVVSCILDLNSAEQAVYAFSVSSAICHKSATRMLKIIRDPAFVPTDLRFAIRCITECTSPKNTIGTFQICTGLVMGIRSSNYGLGKQVKHCTKWLYLNVGGLI